MADNKLIDLEGLKVFKAGLDSEIDQKIQDAGLGITYTLSKNSDGEIILLGSDGKSTKVSDANTEYTFSEADGVLTITGTDGTSETITLGEEITSEKIITALGFTPISAEDVGIEITYADWLDLPNKDKDENLYIITDYDVVPENKLSMHNPVGTGTFTMRDSNGTDVMFMDEDGTVNFKGDIKSDGVSVKNVIETVKVNGTALLPSNKEINISVPTKASDIGAMSSTVTHLSGDIAASEKGVANGVATLGGDGKVPASQLPGYVDDVLEYANKSSFPSTGESGKIYIDSATNTQWRWSGTTYVQISASLALGETSSTAYAGDKGKANADAIATLKARKINGKPLTSDITLSASDIGAVASETDPTVPSHVKSITTANITSWNNKANLSDIGKEITYAEWQALPNKDKDDNLYFITDYEVNSPSKMAITNPVGSGTFTMRNSNGTNTFTVDENGIGNFKGGVKVNGVDIGGTNVTESTVAGWGFTKNAGTVTGIKVNGTTKTPTSGVVDLGDLATKSDFQAGVDGIYNTIVAQGTTPASKSLSDVKTGINTLATKKYNAGVTATKKGTAWANDVLMGKTFTNANEVNISGTMAPMHKFFVASTSDGEVYYSVDNGAHWNKSADLYFKKIYRAFYNSDDLLFLNSMIGLGNSGVCTSNDGIYWVKHINKSVVGIGTYAGFECIFSDKYTISSTYGEDWGTPSSQNLPSNFIPQGGSSYANTWVMCGSNTSGSAQVFVRTSSGGTWNQCNVNLGLGSIKEIICLNESNYIAITSTSLGQVAYFTNYGANVSFYNSFPSTPSFIIKGYNGVYIGCGTSLYVGSNNYATWTKVYDAFTSDIIGASYINQSIVIHLANGVARYSKTGSSWHDLFTAPTNTISICMM